MKQRPIHWVAVLCLVLMGGNCSRERVESLNHMNEGVAYAEAKRFSEAIESLERATVLDPSNDQAYSNLAIVHMESHSYAAAKNALEHAIAVNGEDAGYHEKLGSVLIELKDWKAAKASLEKSLELNPGLFKAHFKLARVHEELEDPQSALYRYTDSINLGPRFLPAHAALGRLYADLGYDDNAAQVLKGGLKVAAAGTDEEANVHHLLGTVYQQQRKFDDAISEFQAALGIAPSMRDALFSLGWTYSLKGNGTEAERYLKKFLVIAGADAPANYVKVATDRLAEIRDENKQEQSAE